MAEREATIVIRYVGDATDAKNAYEELRKHAEQNPVRVGFGQPATSRATDVATFANPTGVAGGAPPPVPTSRGNPYTPGEVGLQMAVSRVIGGAGLGPTGYIPPTASVNSVYGGISAGVPIIPHNPGAPNAPAPAAAGLPQGYAGYARRAVAAGIMSPMSTGDFSQPGGYVLAERELYEWRQQRRTNREWANAPYHAPGYGADGSMPSIPNGAPASPPPLPPSGPGLGLGSRSRGGYRSNRYFQAMRGAFDAYAGFSFAGGLFASQNQFALSEISAGGDPVALARAQIENNAGAAAISSIPFSIGTGIVAAADYISGGRTDAARTLRNADLQNAITVQNRSMGDTLRTSRADLAAASASRAGTYAGTLQGFANQLAAVEPNRQIQYDQASTLIQGRLTTATNEMNAARSALSEVIEYKKPDGTFGYTKQQFDGNGRAITTVPGAASINENDYKRITAYNNAFDAVGSAKEQLNNLGTRTRELAAIQTRTIQANQAAFQTAASVNAIQARLQSQYGIRASMLSELGHSIGAIADSADAQFMPGIAGGMFELMQSMAAGKPVGPETIASITTGLANRAEAMRSGGTALTRSYMGRVGAAAAGIVGMMDPFAGREAAINSRFRSDTQGMDSYSPEYEILESEKNANLLQVQQDRSYFRSDASRSLRFEAMAQQRTLARDPIGAAAIGIAGEGIDRATQLFRSGQFDLAEQARTNAMRNIDITAQNYMDAMSFREVDFRNDYFGDSKSNFDPRQVAETLGNASALIRGADLSDGQISGKEAGAQLDKLNGMMEQLPSRIADEIERRILKN